MSNFSDIKLLRKMSEDHVRNTIKEEKMLPQMLCRLCATKHSDDCMNNLLTSIHNGIYFIDMLQDCLQPQSISRDNSFPLGICFDCTSTLIVVYNFRLMCNGSEKKFREMFDYNSVPDGLEQKVEVIIDESEIDVKTSYFINCTAVDVLNTNCDDINDRDTETELIELKLERKFNKLKAQRYECYLCKATFRRISYLRQHNTNYHSTADKSWSCSECQKRFAQRKHLTKHFYKHTNTNCDHCPETFTTLRDLQHHCQRTHQDILTMNQCEYCPKKFVLNAQLRIHMHNHLNNHHARHNCNSCNEIFPSETQLKTHIRAMHTAFLCAECGKTFKNNSLLTSHQKVHKSEKPFACSLCPSRFKWKVALTYHMTIHQQDRKHVCETCGMSFTTRSAMKGHMKIHTGERPFECDKCSKRFYRRTHLKRHHLSHTGEKPYICKFCDKGFRQCAQLNKHLRLHVGENTYQCDLCPSKFKFKAEMKKHEHEHYISNEFLAGTFASQSFTV